MIGFGTKRGLKLRAPANALARMTNPDLYSRPTIPVRPCRFQL